jgi:propionyl-CoA synthetase
MGRYAEAHKRSLEDKEGFWLEAAKHVSWTKPPTRALEASNPPFYRWFPDGRLNVAHNCLDRHIEAGRGDQLALIYDSPMAGKTETYTYRELTLRVAKFAGGLRLLGVEKGDRVLIYMPMVPEAVIAMLACARIGAIHGVVFGGFAAPELATRIDDAKPKAIVFGSCGLEPGRTIAYRTLVDQALSIAKHKVPTCVVFQRPQLRAEPVQGRDVDFADLEARSQPADPVDLASTDPLYILYTSGTTGIPKGVVRDGGGYAVALMWSMHNVYAIKPGEVWWSASDVGWVVGHSYIVYAPLLLGATTVLYEGKPVGTPDAGAFWRVISQYKIVALFTAPTAFRAIKRDDPDGLFMRKYDLSNFRTLFLAGERCDPNTLLWAEAQLKVPVVDHWWQTETGWAITANCLGLEAFTVKPGSSTKAVPGYDVQALGPDHRQVKPGEVGALAIKLPLPPGSLPTLWQNDQGFLKSYLQEFPGYYKTGDAGYIDEDGYVFVMTRTDDIINVAGHRLSTGGMEEVLSNHPDVAECAVIGVADELKGQLPLGLVVLKAGVNRPHEAILKELVQMVRDSIGPVAAFKTAVVVKRLPKTRSGKILRGTMQKIADDQSWKMPATIDDPATLDEITEGLKTVGYAKGA